MNVVNTGSIYQVYDDGMTTSKELPSLVYDVQFSNMTGFSLVARPDIRVEEEKVYGRYPQKVDKVLNGYKTVERNFGVILSGTKGVGKTLFTKLLTRAARKQGYPIIIVSSYYPGIARFLSSIDQDVVVIFDEFEKTFAEKEDSHPQDELLTLFDGLDSGHKLFVVTCNNPARLSDYLLNRPGRFHYHFILDVPNPEEIREYLEDKLAPPYQNVIPNIINFSSIGKITYDCLRAIAFDLNQGYSIEETLEDLNLVRDEMITCDIVAEFMDDSIYKITSRISFAEKGNYGKWLHPVNHLDRGSIWLEFNPRDIRSSPVHRDEMFIPVADIVKVDYDSYDIEDDNLRDILDKRIKEGLKSVRLIREPSFNNKYLV